MRALTPIECHLIRASEADIQAKAKRQKDKEDYDQRRARIDKELYEIALSRWKKLRTWSLIVVFTALAMIVWQRYSLNDNFNDMLIKQRNAAQLTQSGTLAALAERWTNENDAIKGTLLGLSALIPSDGRNGPWLSEAEHALFDSSLVLFESIGEPRTYGVFVGHKGPVLSVAVSQDGTRLVTGSADMTAMLWDVDTRTKIHDFNAMSEVLGVAFSPRGDRVVLGLADGTARLLDTLTFSQRGVFTGHRIRC